MRIIIIIIMFQSSPSPKAGSYTNCPKVFSTACVSILSQPEGRELLRRDVAFIGGQGVSILSQPEGRELRVDVPFISDGVIVSILSQPEGRELRGRFR